MKKMIAIILCVALAASLAGCSCDHEWVEASCLNAKTCSKCQKTEGEVLGHDWKAATCETAKTCNRCVEVEGEPLGHTPGEWNATADAVACSVFKEQFCTACNAPIASETVPLSTLIQDDLFIITPDAFMERLTLIAEQHSDTFTFQFVPDGVGLQVLVDFHGKQSIIQFFRSDTTALGAGETDTAEVWCISLIAVGENDKDFRHYFLMACDPTLDKDTAFETDMILATELLNAWENGDTVGFYLHNGLLFETIYIVEDAFGQNYSMSMLNIYASDYR